MKRAHEELFAIQNSLIELIMDQETRMDHMFQLIEEVNQLQSQLLIILPHLVHVPE